jgi:hypothetical protein
VDSLNPDESMPMNNLLIFNNNMKEEITFPNTVLLILAANF